MIPNVAKPVIRPQIFRADYQLVFLGKDSSNKDLWVWDLVPGANPDPNDPQRFLELMARNHWSALFSRSWIPACRRGRR
jgi:hypothetical protein